MRSPAADRKYPTQLGHRQPAFGASDKLRLGWEPLSVRSKSTPRGRNQQTIFLLIPALPYGNPEAFIRGPAAKENADRSSILSASWPPENPGHKLLSKIEQVDQAVTDEWRGPPSPARQFAPRGRGKPGAVSVVEIAICAKFELRARREPLLNHEL